MNPDRRDFLRALAATAATAPLLPAQTGAARIEVLPAEPIGTIAPEIHGHFIEHIGGVIYDGIWVGKESSIPNEGGIRRAVLDALKAIQAPVVRWPGGCFADSYDWHNGIGPEASRPARTNFWGGSEPNTFGTQEFMRFCELSGARPYLAANLRSLPSRDFDEWIEYCNSPEGSTHPALERAAQGHPGPFNVHFWGVGNESWGCGGNFTPEDYASEFRRFATWVPEYGDPLALIASGPNGHDVDWTRRLMRSMHERHQTDRIFGLSLHYYTWNLSGGKTQDWNRGKGDALQFGPFEWYELLSQGNAMDSIISDHWSVMSETDPSHHVKLVVDEWGAWYRPGSGLGPKYLYSQTPTLRDALLSGLTLDIFHRHAGKVAMANAAQLINCLHSLMLAREDRFCLTPNYHVFRMYAPHKNAQAVRAEFAADPVHYLRNGSPARLWGLNGSASIAGKHLTLTAVNPHLDRTLETGIRVQGARISGGRAMVLTRSDIHAHNDFDHPDAVVPAPAGVSVHDGEAVCHLPPASVSALYLTLS